MKHLLVITIIAIAISGCSSGNQTTGEVKTAPAGDSVAVPKATTSDTTSEVKTSAKPSSKFEDLRFGMSEEEVIAMLGQPTNRETISDDAKMPGEDWWYGYNQKVRMINHQVNHVVKDVAHQNELLRQLMIAKKNKNEAEAQRIMDELSKDNK